MPRYDCTFLLIDICMGRGQSCGELPELGTSVAFRFECTRWTVSYQTKPHDPNSNDDVHVHDMALRQNLAGDLVTIRVLFR